MAENSVERLLNPWANSTPRLWNKVFLVSCVIGLATDPLFLYILIIDKDKKCLSFDRNMKYVALVLRTATDLFYVFHIVFRLRKALAMSKELRTSVFTGFPWWYLLIDVLAILLSLRFSSKLAGSRSLMTRKMLNLLLLLQYVPRILRVYLSANYLGRSFDSLATRVWIKGAFFFFLYLAFCHTIGAFWYFYAIFRETACWHKACLGHAGCKPHNFECGLPNPKKNITFLNEFCPVDPPNADVHDFGIFLEAIESGLLTKKRFVLKFSRCMWWGLKNLSSFGQNLETSANYIPENFFAILISIVGLLSFLYLIGNLQTYMQLATTKSEERRRKLNKKQPEINSFLSSQSLPKHRKKVIVRYLQHTFREDKDLDIKHLFSLVEEHSDNPQNNNETLATWVAKIVDFKKHERTSAPKIDAWISKNDFTLDMDEKIVRYVRLRLPEFKNVDLGNILPVLPSELAKSVKKILCTPALKKMPILENMDDHVHETIRNYLKPVVYAEQSYIIRKDEPLDFILLVTQGIVWSFGNNASPTERLQRGDFYGKELLEWKLNSGSYDRFPISEANLKCHTKVEGFALMAADVDPVLSICWTKFCRPNKPVPEGLEHFAATSLEQGYRRYRRHKKAKENQIVIVTQHPQLIDQKV